MMQDYSINNRYNISGTLKAATNATCAPASPATPAVAPASPPPMTTWYPAPWTVGVPLSISLSTASPSDNSTVGGAS